MPVSPGRLSGAAKPAHDVRMRAAPAAQVRTSPSGRAIAPRIVLILCVCLLVVAGALLAAAQTAADPGTSVAFQRAVGLLGKATTDPLVLGLPCAFTSTNYSRYAHCVYEPRETAIRRVQLSALDGEIVQLNIWPNASFVRYGDLERIWGRPVVRGRSPEGVYALRWPWVGAETRVESVGGYLSYYASVIVIGVDDEQPHGSPIPQAPELITD